MLYKDYKKYNKIKNSEEPVSFKDKLFMDIYEEGGKKDNNNRSKAYNYLINKHGIKPHIAAGIVGNLMKESYRDIRPTASGDKGTAFGIAQWRLDRRRNLEEFAGENINDLNTQLDFLVHELEGEYKSVKSSLDKTTTPEEAALVFSKKYERPHKDFAENELRQSYAREVFGQGELMLAERDEKKTPPTPEVEQQVTEGTPLPTDVGRGVVPSHILTASTEESTNTAQQELENKQQTAQERLLIKQKERDFLKEITKELSIVDRVEDRSDRTESQVQYSPQPIHQFRPNQVDISVSQQT